MPKIYTRTGDTGETVLVGGSRVRKDELRVEAMGTVDELNAAIGMVRAELGRAGAAPVGMDVLLARLQHELFDLGAEIAAPDPSALRLTLVGHSQVTQLEAAIDEAEQALTPLREFILPGGTPAAAALHVARGVCRRAERRLVTLSANAPLRGEVIKYINRLSDLLFVLARGVNRAHRVPDVTWKQDEASRDS